MSAAAFLVVAVFGLGFIGIAIGIHTKAGSGIERHPSDGTDHEGGAEAPLSEGSARMTVDDDGGSDPFNTYGTR